MSNALHALKRLLSALESGSTASAADVSELKRAVQAIETGDRYTPAKEFGRRAGRPRKQPDSEKAALAIRRVGELVGEGHSQKSAVEWLTARTHLTRKGPRELSISSTELYRLLSEDLRSRRADFLCEFYEDDFWKQPP